MPAALEKGKLTQEQQHLADQIQCAQDLSTTQAADFVQ
jgi:hypothetical protein